jgi:ribosomal peptide maturation radical SAM protein 1
MKYRSKSTARVLEELKQLCYTYGIRKFHVVDNMLDLKYFDRLFPGLEHEKLGIDLFYETKANLSRKQLLQMKRAGVNNIQPGIESLSDEVLTLMKKGISALLNIQLLKWSKELNITPHWNLLYGFPGESKEEYFQMAKIIPLIMHLYPPGAFGNLTLDRFSPYFIEPSKNGLVNVRPLKAYTFVYPWPVNEVQRISYHFDYDYFDGRDPETYTKELREQLSKWKTLWLNNNIPTLNMIKIGKMIVINDTRPCAVQKLHVLYNEKAMVYEICDSVYSFQSIFMRMKLSYPHITESDLDQIVSDLINMKLMMYNEQMYLSLAVLLA